jgi:hypothetical protein
MAWNNAYRLLKEGEIVLETDEILDDHGRWMKPVYSVGKPAPNPLYTSHRQFRRRIDHPADEGKGK